MNGARPITVSPIGPGGALTVQRQAAEAAAAAAGVRVIAGEDPELLSSALALVQQIWRADASDAPVTMAVLRAVTHAGGYCAIAVDERQVGRPVVGACIAFLGSRPARSLHSHIAGVADAGLGRGVGFALKLDQRAWAAEQALEMITWTFDPLVRRNAYFNLAKLGVRVSEYLPDFYGAMDDSVNAGQGSDRLLVEWPVTDPGTRVKASETVAPQQVMLDRRPDEPDEPAPIREVGPGPVAIRIPADIERLRRERPEAAVRWRYALRDSLGVLLRGAGPTVTISRDGWYLVTPIRDDG